MFLCISSHACSLHDERDPQADLALAAQKAQDKADLETDLNDEKGEKKGH